MPVDSAPHLQEVPLVTSRRGQLWIPGDRITTASGTVQRAPMYVMWEAPENVTQPHPVVLVHGGGGQGTDWLGTMGGGPGWAAAFVAAGFATYVVDRPGHGRSPYHPDVLGPMGPPFPYEAAQGLFAPASRADEQTQWPYGREIGDPELDQLVAGMGPLPADLAESQRLDAARLAALLTLLGPSVLVTHSAGSPAGWLVADLVPDLIAGIAAIEPLGPPFVEFPGIGALDWGITAAPLTYAAGFTSATQVRSATDADRRVPALRDTPVVVVTGTASVFRESAPAMVDFLRAAGAEAVHLDLGDHGVSGNGHGLVFEANAEKTAAPVIDWVHALGR